MAFRRLKATVRTLIAAPDFEKALAELAALPARQVINPLFGLLYDGDPLTRWRAVSALGRVVTRLADQDIESARVIMRRLMWNLNDESGGIGWGSPEAMGEIMAGHERLACEYSAILISYLDPEGNFLEHPGLQHGVLWAVGRLGRVRPQFTRPALPFVAAFFDAPDPALRGLALWAALPIADRSLEQLVSLIRDRAEVTLFDGQHFRHCSVGDLAAEVLAGLPDRT